MSIAAAVQAIASSGQTEPEIILSEAVVVLFQLDASDFNVSYQDQKTAADVLMRISLAIREYKKAQEHG